VLRFAAPVLFALALAGCLAAEDAPLAPLPDSGIFVAMAWACGTQPHPMGDLVVVDADGALRHVAIEASDAPLRAPNLSMPSEEAARVVTEAVATGLAIGTYHERWLHANGTIIHAERVPLDASAFERLRGLVAAASFADLAREYDGDTLIADGCSYGYAAWIHGGYRAVGAIDDGGPAALDDLRAWLLARHGREAW